MSGLLRGWLKSSLVEYPGRVCSVVFTGGCNLRCPYCHNPDLVLRPESLPAYPASEVLAWLQARRGMVGALVVSGGEPTIHPWLETFLRDARSRGLATGIATNGTNPGVLASLMASRLLDFVAMDVKTLLEPGRYAAATGSDDASLSRRVRDSFELLSCSPIPYEIRCTVLPELHSAEILLELAAQLRGARRLVFQEFHSSSTLDPRFRLLPAFPAPLLQSVREAAATLVGECLIRGAGAILSPAPRVEEEPPPPSSLNSKGEKRRYSVQNAANVVQ